MGTIIKPMTLKEEMRWQSPFARIPVLVLFEKGEWVATFYMN